MGTIIGSRELHVLLVMCAILCAACAEAGARLPDAAAPQATGVPTKDPAIRENPVTRDPTVVRFLATLQARGISVEPQNPSGLVFLLVPGHVYRLSGGRAYIHPYPSEARAIEEVPRAVAGAEDPRVQWIDAPHFFRCDSLIVAYFGQSEPDLRELTSLCGPQFAGA